MTKDLLKSQLVRSDTSPAVLLVSMASGLASLHAGNSTLSLKMEQLLTVCQARGRQPHTRAGLQPATSSLAQVHRALYPSARGDQTHSATS